MGSSRVLPVQASGQPAKCVFLGRRDQVSRARRFVAEALGPVPALDDITLLVSELCTNALQHTASGDGGTFEVAVFPGALSVRVEVRDAGSDQVPLQDRTSLSAEYGRGLGLVGVIADRWGHFGDRHSRTVFFELAWKAPGA